jgi:hypothetical protein
MTRFTLVIPDDLNAWLEQQATNAGRSKVQQVACILDQWRRDTIAHRSALALDALDD